VALQLPGTAEVSADMICNANSCKKNFYYKIIGVR
jgi:hypothetical protein